MTHASTYSNASPTASGWSNRVLIAAVAGIFFLTLYPFRFTFTRHLVGDVPPYFLGRGGKPAGVFDAFLNVLLFVPFGFGVAGKLRERGRSWIGTFAISLAAGALLSYAIEIFQIYIPFRDSGWEDVFTNSTGAVVGSLVLALCGRSVLLCLSASEKFLDLFLTWPRAVLVLSGYLALWFAISIPLQKETKLSNWSPDALLVVGNAASGRLASAWKGEILQLQIWNRAVAPEFARDLASGQTTGSVDPVPLAAYEFSGSSPFQDRRHFLPDLDWAPRTPALVGSMGVSLEGKSWLVSRGPVSALVNDFQETRQFSIQIVCKPAEVDGVDSRIVSISRASGPVNLEIRQEDSKLTFWFRNPLSVKRSGLTWTLSDVFATQQPRDFLFSYDGSNLTLYTDGQQERRAYPLGPGASLAQFVRRIKPGELEGYRYIFYAIVFLPAGSLLGLAWRNLIARPVGRYFVMAFGYLVPAALLEIILVRVSGRAMSLGNIIFGALLTLGGSLWINADRGAPNPSLDPSARNLES